MRTRNQLAANTRDGVYVCENAAARQNGQDVLVDCDFYNALADLEDGAEIYGSVNNRIALIIEDEFGIR